MSAAPPTRRKSSPLQSQQGALSWQQVHVAIVALGEPAAREQLEMLHGLLERFVAENDCPRDSPHLRATGPDRLDPLAALLARPDVAAASPAARLLALRALKILARRGDVRLRCTQHVLNVVAPLLDAAAGAPLELELASEAANALSNLCYEPINCTGLLKAGGVPRLLKLLCLESGGGEARANAAGALQTLCLQPDARAAVLQAGGPARLLHALAGAGSSGSANAAGDAQARLQQRLAGALHNLSSEAGGVAALRQQGGIPPVVGLLASPHPGVAAAAAGALQNMSREAQARADIRAHPDALPGLVMLLTGADTQVGRMAGAPAVTSSWHLHTHSSPQLSLEADQPRAPHPCSLLCAGGGVRCRHAGQPGRGGVQQRRAAGADASAGGGAGGRGHLSQFRGRSDWHTGRHLTAQGQKNGRPVAASTMPSREKNVMLISRRAEKVGCAGRGWTDTRGSVRGALE